MIIGVVAVVVCEDCELVALAPLGALPLSDG
jgi:hypothetical protein